MILIFVRQATNYRPLRYSLLSSYIKTSIVYLVVLLAFILVLHTGKPGMAIVVLDTVDSRYHVGSIKLFKLKLSLLKLNQVQTTQASQHYDIDGLKGDP